MRAAAALSEKFSVPNLFEGGVIDRAEALHISFDIGLLCHVETPQFVRKQKLQSCFYG